MHYQESHDPYHDSNYMLMLSIVFNDNHLNQPKLVHACARADGWSVQSVSVLAISAKSSTNEASLVVTN